MSCIGFESPRFPRVIVIYRYTSLKAWLLCIQVMKNHPSTTTSNLGQLYEESRRIETSSI